MLGALVGGGWRRSADDPGFDPQRTIPGVHWLFDRLPRTQWIFWTSLVGVIAATLPLCLLAGVLNPIDCLAEAAWAFLSLGPLYLVLAWLVGVIRLARQPSGTVGRHEFRALHRSLLGVIVGAAAGFLVIFVWLGLLVYIGYLPTDTGRWLGVP